MQDCLRRSRDIGRIGRWSPCRLWRLPTAAIYGQLEFASTGQTREISWAVLCGRHVTTPKTRHDAKHEDLPRALPEAAAPEVSRSLKELRFVGRAAEFLLEPRRIFLTPTATPSPSACRRASARVSRMASCRLRPYSSAKKCGAQPPAWWHGSWIGNWQETTATTTDKATCGYVCSK